MLSAGKKRDEALQLSAYALRAFAIKLCNDEHKYSQGEEPANLALEYALRMAKRDNALIPMLQNDLKTISLNAALAQLNESQRKSGGPCFIASAVYGSPNHSAVVALRSFRDSVLMHHVIGRGFVAVYYRIGPYLGDRGASSPFLKAQCRKLLNRLLALIRCNQPVNDSLPSKHL